MPYHPQDQPPGTTAAQVELVDRYLPAGVAPWGICTECGMGRVDATDVPTLLDLHSKILSSSR